MHYYQFNIADYRKDTTHLSRLEHSIYRDLIDWCYLDEAPIPLDLSLVSRKLRLCSTDDERALNNVLTDFFECTNEGYTQKRIQQEIDAFHLTIANASKAGKASAEARKNKQLEQALNLRSTNQEPITNNQEPSKPKEHVKTDHPEEKKKPTATATRLPADWVPSDDDFEFCKAERQDLTPSVVADRFRDYWIAQPGAKGRKVDWPATWRNWVRNEKLIGGAVSGAKSQYQINHEATTRAIFGSMLDRPDSLKTIEGEVVR